MWHSAEIIFADQELELIDLQVYRNRFPPDICRAVHEHILTQPERKTLHRLTDPSYVVPEPLEHALHYPPFLSQGNTLISKRYDGESRAFAVHRDPTEYAKYPLVICSMGGLAVLSVIFEDRRLIQIECGPNTVVVMHNDLMHAVTPTLDARTRTIIFGGTDAAEPYPLYQWHEFLLARMTA